MIRKIIFIYLLIADSVFGQNPIGLRAAAYLRELLFGTAADVENLRGNFDNGQYVQEIQQNYLLIVPENEFKPIPIWKGENNYNWVDADFLLGAPNATGWTQQNLMQLRGHNLVWAPDDCVPSWLLQNESTITSDKAKQLLTDYIHAIVGRYKGKIPWWDVVNEAIDDSDNKNPLNLRDGFWFRKLGPDYIKYAFMFAHEADPDLQLYYNEYGIENVGPKATRTVNLVNWLRSQGATVHGIGLQWHIGVSTNITPGDDHYQSAQQFTSSFVLAESGRIFARPLTYPSIFRATSVFLSLRK